MTRRGKFRVNLVVTSEQHNSLLLRRTFRKKVTYAKRQPTNITRKITNQLLSIYRSFYNLTTRRIFLSKRSIYAKV